MTNREITGTCVIYFVHFTMNVVMMMMMLKVITMYAGLVDEAQDDGGRVPGCEL